MPAHVVWCITLISGESERERELLIHFDVQVYVAYKLEAGIVSDRAEHEEEYVAAD